MGAGPLRSRGLACFRPRQGGPGDLAPLWVRGPRGMTNGRGSDLGQRQARCVHYAAAVPPRATPLLLADCHALAVQVPARIPRGAADDPASDDPWILCPRRHWADEPVGPRLRGD